MSSTFLEGTELRRRQSSEPHFIITAEDSKLLGCSPKYALTHQFSICMTVLQFIGLLMQLLSHLPYFVQYRKDSVSQWYGLWDCCPPSIYDANNFIFPTPRFTPVEPAQNVKELKELALNIAVALLIMANITSACLCALLVVGLTKIVHFISKRYGLGLVLSVSQTCLLLISAWISTTAFDLYHPNLSIGAAFVFQIVALILSAIVMLIAFVVPDILPLF